MESSSARGDSSGSEPTAAAFAGSAVLVPWLPNDDPSVSAITPRTVHRMVAAKHEDSAAVQRLALYRLRDRLQAAVFAGTHTDVVERATDNDELVLLREFEANREKYGAGGSGAKDADGSSNTSSSISASGGGGHESTFAIGKCNVHTASLLYRQFEMISRRGIAVEEMEERQGLMHHYWASARGLWTREKSRAHRGLVDELTRLQQHATEATRWVGATLEALEESSRGRLAGAADDAFGRLFEDRRAVIATVAASERIGQQQRIVLQEELARHVVAVEHEKTMGQLFVGEMNGAHETQLRLLMRASRTEQVREASLSRRAALMAELAEPSDSDASDSTSSLVQPYTRQYLGSAVSTGGFAAYGRSAVGGSGDSERVVHSADELALPGAKAAAMLRLPTAGPTHEPKRLALKAKGQTLRGPQHHAGAAARPSPSTSHVPTGTAAAAAAALVTAAPPPPPPSAAATSGPSRTPPPHPAAQPSARPQFMVDADEESTASDGGAGGGATGSGRHRHHADSFRSELLSHRQQLTSLTHFQQCFGWMLKSTGVMMTWQKRFFALTSKGKLRYTTTEPQPGMRQRWITLVNAEDIVRVELDTTASAKPPMDQYHQYCFYVDAACREGKEIRQRRVRFCCFHRSDNQMWLAALRHATDVVFALEERGDLPRSPLRRLLDPAVMATLLDSEPVRHYSLRSPVPQTYRRRMQTELEVASIEEHLKEVDAQAKAKQHNKEVVAALRSYSPTRFGVT